MPRPNILFFFSDQQRWDTCGCYGQPLAVTPNLDRMAAEGVRFEHAFTCQPVCGPARSCLQTGAYATESGCITNGVRLPLDAKTIAHYLGDTGAQTAYIGKWHLASMARGTAQNGVSMAVPPERRGGWRDHWLAADFPEFTSHGYDGYLHDGDGNRVDFTGYRADCVTDFALDYLREGRDPDRSFFLMVSYVEPHHQPDHNRYEGPDGSKERFKDFVVPGDLEGAEGDWRESYPDYLGCCASLDANLGRIRATLDELGLGDDTLLLYASDHGSHFRTRNAEYKRSCHDGCIRIPMIACGPGFRGGRVVDDRLVSLIDVPPTFLETAGLERPASMRGRPLQEAVAGAADWPEEVFLQISESQVGRAIRTRRWKYAVTAPDADRMRDAGSAVYVEDFLYDLDADPHERNNLVRDPALADTRAQLGDRLIARMQAAGEPAPGIDPAP